MNDKDIKFIVRECVETMISNIHYMADIPDGDFAAQFFCDDSPEWNGLSGLLEQYLRDELRFRGKL